MAFRKSSPSLFSQMLCCLMTMTGCWTRHCSFSFSLWTKRTYHLVMTGDVGLLEKGAQSRLWKEREREKEMGISWRDLCYNMNEQNNSGLETAALCSLLPPLWLWQARVNRSKHSAISMRVSKLSRNLCRILGTNTLCRLRDTEICESGKYTNKHVGTPVFLSMTNIATATA